LSNGYIATGKILKNEFRSGYAIVTGNTGKA